jgi:phenylacetate-CoA ligase
MQFPTVPMAKRYFDAVQRLRGWDYLPWLEKLEALQWAPAPQVEEYRLGRLRAMLAHCQANVPFYRDEFRRLALEPADIRTPADLKRLPKVTKSTLRADYSRFVAAGSPRALDVWPSSGSSGEPFPFRRSKEGVAMNTFAPWSRGRRWWGMDFGAREAQIWAGARHVGGRLSARVAALKRRVSWRMKNIKLIDVYHQDAATVRRTYAGLLRFEPSFMRAMASGLYRFCATVEDLGLDGRALGVRAAIITGESLLRAQRSLIERVLGCKTVIEYGCTELGVIAFECPSGGLHLTHENHIFEFECDGRDARPGERAELVITNLNERAVPLLRYAIGDIVVPADGACPCGRSMPLIASVEGRVHDDILTPAGQVVHAMFFTHMFDAMPSVHQFRVVQENINSLRIEIRGSRGIAARDKDFIRSAGEQAMGSGVKVEVVEVGEMPVSSSGKQPWIVSKLNANRQSAEPRAGR